MTCAGCNQLELDPGKTLIDGSVVCSDCPAWRLECEARHVVNLPSIEARRAHLDYRTRKSKAAGEELRALVGKLWSMRKTVYTSEPQSGARSAP